MLKPNQISELANQIADEINEKGLEFGGRFEDVQLIIELANERVEINPEAPKSKGKGKIK
jgi:hypothetical protein